jgi:ATP-dependent RNA helicase DDX46/PRP5
LNHICEYAEVGITVRGIYVAPGREPPQGERKLFLAIEGLSEKGLSLAKAEITRTIKDEVGKMVSSSKYNWLFFVLPAFS